MEDLMQVVKEANENIAELRNTWETYEDVVAHYKPYYERVKDKCSDLRIFFLLCEQELRGLGKSGQSTSDRIKDLVELANKNGNKEAMFGEFTILKKIKSKVEYTAEELVKIEKVIQKIEFYPKQQPDFNEFGLRYNVEELTPVLQGALIFLPLENMAEFVDVVTKGNIDESDQQFINDLLEINPSKEDYKQWNVTSIGNLAYVALYCKNNTAKEIAIKCLEGFYDHCVIMTNNLLNNLKN